MPAKVKKIKGKFRVVEPDGSIVKNTAGSAVDGGGFPTEAAAKKQAAAINISKHRRKK